VKKYVNARNSREVGLYLVTGILGSLVDFLVFALCLWSGLPPIISQWAGAGSGAVHNFLIYHYVVFTHSKRLRHTVLPNTLLSLATIIISGPLLLLLVQATGNVWLSKVIILTFTAVVTYIVRKLMIFK
jgi:putative flippase GtrA